MLPHYESNCFNFSSDKALVEGVCLCVCVCVLGNLCVCVSAQNLNTDALVVEHVMVNRAPRTRRRTYRAHGRINRK